MSKCRLFTSGVAVAAAVYLLTNPYIVINAVIPSRWAILASNFGNSLAMYEISRVVEGFVRVMELTIEGAGLPIVVVGAVAIIILVSRRFRGWDEPVARTADGGLEIADVQAVHVVHIAVEMNFEHTVVFYRFKEVDDIFLAGNFHPVHTVHADIHPGVSTDIEGVKILDIAGFSDLVSITFNAEYIFAGCSAK